MSRSQNSRNPRKKDIPQGFIRNWQCSSGTEGTKPLVRRPITACEACRTAKVKCSGQQGCERCTNRGTECIFNTRDNPTSHSRPPSTDSNASATNVTSDGSSSVLGTDNFDAFNINDLSYQQSNGSATDWPQDLTNSQVGPLDWTFLNGGLNDYTYDDSSHSSIADVDNSSAMMLAQPGQNFVGSGTGVNKMTNSPIPSRNTPSQCQCQAQVMLHPPTIKAVLEESSQPRVDEVLKVTRDVLKSCQDAVDCSRCRLKGTDLIGVLAVFQQTEACFNYIAHSDQGSTMPMFYGGYEVPAGNDTNLRRMLVMDLVKQATSLLDSLCSLGQNMYPSPQACKPLSQVNQDYLRQVISKFRCILRTLSDSLGAG